MSSEGGEETMLAITISPAHLLLPAATTVHIRTSDLKSDDADDDGDRDFDRDRHGQGHERHHHHCDQHQTSSEFWVLKPLPLV